MNAPLNLVTTPSDEQMRERRDHVTRQLHEAIVELGLDIPLQAIAAQIPDARDRLEYVGQLTERAAHKVLGLVEEAQPGCSAWLAKADDASAKARSALTSAQTPEDELRAALELARQALEQSAAGARQQQEVLTNIMMAQDFQDLSGQVIKKAIAIISDTQTGLLSLLGQGDGLPVIVPSREPPKPAVLEGPQVPDKALDQGDVDDMLAALGF
jgi:chemotaxis protein CheZ